MRLFSSFLSAFACAGLTTVFACNPYAGMGAQQQQQQLQLSSAAYHDARFDKSSADLDVLITEQTKAKGYTAESDAMTGKLESFAGHSVSLKRGRCYVMVLRLDPDATFSDHARKGVSFIFTGVDGFQEVNGGPGITGPGGVGSAGCPQADAPRARFDLQAYFGSAFDKSKVHDLGKGGYYVQLFSKPISDGQLGAIRADQDQQIKEQKEFAAQERARSADRARKGCATCQRKHTECIADFRRHASRSQCESELRSCVFSQAGLASPSDCER